jgi:coenzyme F420-reducing hydrogenase beta subunit
VLEIWQARASAGDLAGRVQYGGVVSTLVALALEGGLVRAAALTAAGPGGSPRGVLARDRREVLAAAGSIYAAGGGLSVLNQALARPGEQDPLALVGLPCQVLAAAAMRAHPAYPQAGRRLALVIGLFCTWNLDARRLRGLLAREGVEGPVERADIPPPPAEVLRITTAGSERDIPLDRVRACGLAGCAQCPDLTSELADISVGAREGRPRWNTVLVRTPAGARLLEQAREQLSYTRVTAPYKGIVTQRHVQVGEVAHPGTALMSGISLEQLRVTVDVPQSLIIAIRSKGKARVQLPGGRWISVTDMTIFPFADPASNTFKLRLLLPRKVEHLFPGMLVKTAFETGIAPALVVPVSAVAYRSEVTGVYVLDEDEEHIRFRYVRLGEALGEEVVTVLSGLQEGDKVFIDPIKAGVALKRQRRQAREQGGHE